MVVRAARPRAAGRPRWLRAALLLLAGGCLVAAGRAALLRAGRLPRALPGALAGEEEEEEELLLVVLW